VLKDEAAFRTKIHKQEKWPVPRCIAHSTKTTLQLLLAGLHPTTLMTRTSRRWEAEGVEEEAKVWFNLLFASSPAAPSSVVPRPP
jgi:hypothetical protein